MNQQVYLHRYTTTFGLNKRIKNYKKIMLTVKSLIKSKAKLSSKSLLSMCILTGLLSLSGCATHSATKQADNHQAKPLETKSLSAEFVFKYLIGEIAGQRGDLASSGAVFYELAKTERDPRLAERAAKIAVYGNMPQLAIPAFKLWNELDPASTEAQQAMTEILIESGKLKETEPYLKNLLAKEENQKSGFLYLNTLLAKSPNKAAVLKLVKSLAAPYPELAEAHFAVAQAAWTASQDDIALKALDKVEALSPDWNIAVLLKGQVLFAQSPQTAINFYQEFLDKNPDAFEIRINLAKVLLSQKQIDAVKQELPLIAKYANGPSKNNKEIMAVVGLLAYQCADYTMAENYFHQALNLEGNGSDKIYIYLAETAEKLHQHEKAILWYEKVPLGHNYLEAQLGLAHIIARTQSVDKAIEKLDVIDHLNNEQHILVIQTQAQLLAKADRNQEAFDLLDKSVKNLANTPELVYDYALAAERLGNFELMESELRRAIGARPNFAAAYNALGYSFADRNINLDESIKLIEKALSLEPNSYYILDSLGWAHYRKGDLDKALFYLEQAYKTNPEAEIAAHLGETLWQKGQHEAAKKIWEEGLSIDPNNKVLITTINKFKS